MRRGLRHRLCAMAAGRRDGRGLAQRPRPPTICKMLAAVACVILSFLLGWLSVAKYNVICNRLKPGGDMESGIRGLGERSGAQLWFGGGWWNGRAPHIWRVSSVSFTVERIGRGGGVGGVGGGKKAGGFIFIFFKSSLGDVSNTLA